MISKKKGKNLEILHRYRIFAEKKEIWQRIGIL